MLAEELLQSGQLPEALADLQQHIRREPGNPKFRVFLFQLLSVLGDWDRASAQLEVAGQLDAGTLLMVQMYREALRCEFFRREVFAGHRTPLLFGEPAEWLALLVESFRLTSLGEFAQGSALRERAFDAAPATAGVITLAAESTHSFEWLADADPRFGPVLEVVLQGKYYWIPVARISKIDFEPPTDLRDFVWAAAHFVWTNGGEAIGLIPARYSGSESHGDPQVRLGRKTDWVDQPDGLSVGVGQRMLATDVGEFALLDIRSITFHSADEPSSTDAVTPVGEEPHG
ncbi:MAG: type VI secretion system accessory protein TagJ [Planctomycetota bacterium]|nr:type VI secretion system accessory protein TagJ [Planctomycetota bacterium]